eukprot:2550573-Rhodomonas_salina.1
MQVSMHSGTKTPVQRPVQNQALVQRQVPLCDSGTKRQKRYNKPASGTGMWRRKYACYSAKSKRREHGLVQSALGMHVVWSLSSVSGDRAGT